MPNRLVWVAALALGSACYSPSLRDCSITCGTGGTCPSGLSCGADSYCHADPAESCTFVLEDARRADANPNRPDARPIDAPKNCEGGNLGEPDDTCPGEQVGPVVEGTHQGIDGRRIFPAGDADIYSVILALLPHPSCHESLSYAVTVTLTNPTDTDQLRLRRVTTENRSCRTSDTSGTQLCIPFTQPCTATTIPSFLFEVIGNNNATSCNPYFVDVHLCPAGSTCDTCK